MPTVSAAMPGPVVMAVLVASAYHDEATWLAELRPLRFHARGYLRHVRNNVGAQPHRVGRAGLARRVAALRRRAIDAINKDTGQQRQPAKETSNPHRLFSRFRKFVSRKATVAAVQAAVDGYRQICRLPRHPGSTPARRKVAKVGFISGVQHGLDERTGRRQCSPQAKPRESRGRFLAMSFWQGAMAPSVISAVALSNDMCRQNFPSGIV
jgi:hypothetical protein